MSGRNVIKKPITRLQPINMNNNTVFVLGAGASKPYYLPLGNELKQEMIKNLNDEVFKVNLNKSGFDKAHIDAFFEALPRTSYSTIDIFLEKKKRYREIGAYVIAYTLFPLENEAMLFSSESWYTHLYKALNLESNQPDINNFTFVTLNYDRSLECFLTKTIQYNCPDDCIEYAEKKLSSLKIIHPHGSLGSYPQTPYGIDRQNKEAIEQAAQNIRIISDNFKDSIAYQESRKAITSADNIVFIGFGYHETILKLLTDNMDLSNKRILGTTIGVNQDTFAFLKTFFNDHFEFADTSSNAVEFIKDILPV